MNKQRTMKQKLASDNEYLKMQLKVRKEKNLNIAQAIQDIEYEILNLKRPLYFLVLAEKSNEQKEEDLRSSLGRCYFKAKRSRIIQELSTLEQCGIRIKQELQKCAIEVGQELYPLKQGLEKLKDESAQNEILINHMEQKIQKTTKKISSFYITKEDQTEEGEINKKISVLDSCIDKIEKCKKTLPNSHVANLQENKKENVQHEQII